jgi:DNA-directed RNA polymerase specialized sigma24 family protein
MASFDTSVTGLGRSFPGASLEWPKRAPWRRGLLSPEEAAATLRARRAELLRAARTRADARGVPEAALEELVDEAVATVVMMRGRIVSDHHLLGAFWKALGILVYRHHEGRSQLRVGSRTRADFDLVARRATAEGPGPEEVTELKERVAWAADFAAQLSELERRVVAVMARRGVGPKHAARVLGVPLGEVRAALRSASSAPLPTYLAPDVTRSSATRTPGTRIMVRPFFTFTSPEIPAWRISVRIRLRETTKPWPRRSSACTLLEP